jgi:tetratricopeptide (TPR) repeat protein
VDELDAILRKIEGGQLHGCLQYLEQLEQNAKHRDRACFLAMKCMVLRALGHFAAAEACAATFVEKHPQSPVAHAEFALVATINGDPRAGMKHMEQALAISQRESFGTIARFVHLMGDLLFEQCEWLAARELLRIAAQWAPDDQDTVSRLLDYHGSDEVPLLCKENPPLPPCPSDVPWRGRFEEAEAHLRTTRWEVAEKLFGDLCEEAPDSPAIWGRLAAIRAWRADTEGAVAALRNFATLDVPWEDAVEAEALAMLISPDPLGDVVDVLQATWTLSDFDRSCAALLNDPRVYVSPHQFAGDGESPPPRAGMVLLDRPMPPADGELSLEVVPHRLAHALLFGKETDREARLVVGDIRAPDFPHVATLLKALLGDAIREVGEVRVIGRVSLSQDHLRIRIFLSPQFPYFRVEPLLQRDRVDFLLNRWPQMKLGVLDGRFPAEVVREPQYHRRLQAAILTLQCLCEDVALDFDFNELRRRLGLPSLDSIDPAQFPVDQIRLERLARVDDEKLSEELLWRAFRRALLYNLKPAIRKFGRAILKRPGAANFDETIRIHIALLDVAPTLEEKLASVREARNRAEAHGAPTGCWDLLELRLHYSGGNAAEVLELCRHIQTTHLSEPGVSEAFLNFLGKTGMLQPKGTGRGRHRASEGRPLAAATEGASATDAEPPPQELWTPDSTKPGGGKLWVPD